MDSKKARMLMLVGGAVATGNVLAAVVMHSVGMSEAGLAGILAGANAAGIAVMLTLNGRSGQQTDPAAPSEPDTRRAGVQPVDPTQSLPMLLKPPPGPPGSHQP